MTSTYAVLSPHLLPTAVEERINNDRKNLAHVSHANRRPLLCSLVHGGCTTDGDVKIDVDSPARRIPPIRPTYDLARSITTYSFLTSTDSIVSPFGPRRQNINKQTPPRDLDPGYLCMYSCLDSLSGGVTCPSCACFVEYIHAVVHGHAHTYDSITVSTHVAIDWDPHASETRSVTWF